MCDYSLHHVASRPAKVTDKLVTTELARSSVRGFAAVGEHGAKLVIDDSQPKVAVCLLPGTELAFDEEVQFDRAISLFGTVRVKSKVASFRQIQRDDPHVHYDALEFPNGQVVKLTRLTAGQTATVLQLPVVTQQPEPDEAEYTRSHDYRFSLNRESCEPGVAPILMPNQAAVMLWQTVRGAAIRFSMASAHSFRRLKASRRHPVLETAAPAETFEASLKKGVRASPKKGAAQKPEKKIDAQTAA